MKNFKKLFIFILISFCFVGLFGKNLKVSASGNYVEKSDVGYGYNIVRAPFVDKSYVRLGQPIYDSDWLDSLSKGLSTLNSTDIIDISGTSLSSLNQSLSNELSLKFGLEGTYSDFSGVVSSVFRQSLTTSQSQYLSSYHHYFSYTYKKKRIYLENYTRNQQYYQQHMDSLFLNEIQALNNKINNLTITDQDYYNFFDRNGTHIIHDATYGYRVEMAYSILSNYHIFDSNNSKNITASIEASYNNIISGSGSSSSSLSSALNYGQSKITDYFNIKLSGGDAVAISGYSDFRNKFNNWINTFKYNGVNESENNYTLVLFDYNGLLPIWEALPSEYANLSNNLRLMFVKYKDIYKTSFEYKGGDVLFYPNVYSRNNEFTITDSKILKQGLNFDEVITSNVFPSFLSLKSRGYNYVSITLNYEMKEVYDGYQNVYIYPKAYDNTDSNYIIWEQMTYGGDVKNTNYSSVENNFLNISIDKFLSSSENDNGFNIRYNANGNGEDTWKNQKITVSVVVSKNPIFNT